MEFNETFSAFHQEALFTKEILGIGVTQLYKANYASKGIYYEAFTCLSTGIERMEKLCLILDYYIDHQGNLPSESCIRSYGHKISKLYETCEEIAQRRKIPFRYRSKMEENIRQAILAVLSSFAESSGRYSNMNVLLGSKKSTDCTEQWFHTVDEPLYSKHVSQRKKAEIEYAAAMTGAFLDQYARVLYQGEDRAALTEAEQTSKRTGMWQAVAPYRQLYMLQIIRYLAEILIELGHEAQKINLQDIPYFSEIFGLFCNSNAYFRSRKTWDNVQ